MKYAVIKTGGKQYKINEGDIIDIERLPSTPEKAVTFRDVLMVTDGEDVQLGFPILTGASVLGTVVEDLRGEKIRVAKFKAKARYRRVMGHRQALTRVKIDSILLNGEKAMKKAVADTKKEVKPASKTKKS